MTTSMQASLEIGMPLLAKNFSIVKRKANITDTNRKHGFFT